MCRVNRRQAGWKGIFACSAASRVDALEPERDPSRTPLFQAKFDLQNLPAQDPKQGDPAHPGVQMGSMNVESKTSKFDILVIMLDDQHGISGAIEYSTDLFEKDRIIRLAKHFIAIMEQVVDKPNMQLAELKTVLLATDKEEQRMQHQNTQRKSSQKMKNVKRKAHVVLHLEEDIQ